MNHRRNHSRSNEKRVRSKKKKPTRAFSRHETRRISGICRLIRGSAKFSNQRVAMSRGQNRDGMVGPLVRARNPARLAERIRGGLTEFALPVSVRVVRRRQPPRGRRETAESALGTAESSVQAASRRSLRNGRPVTPTDVGVVTSGAEDSGASLSVNSAVNSIAAPSPRRGNPGSERLNCRRDDISRNGHENFPR